MTTVSPFPSIDFALESDLTEVWSIYDYYVRHSVATFAYVTPSPEELRSEWQRLHPFYPYLVGRWKGAVIGYAYAHPHSPRAAYQWTVELSIYRPSARSRRRECLRLHHPSQPH